MPTEFSGRSKISSGTAFSPEREFRAIKENLARTRFDMSPAEFTEAWSQES